MANNNLDLQNRMVSMEGSYSSKPINLKNARVTEGLSFLTETKVEFVSSNDDVDLQDMLGSTIELKLADADHEDRFFSGTCIAVEYIGLYQGMSHFVADVRPWLWFLTRTQENRIFQEKSVLDILQEVLGDYGFWSDVEKKTTETYKKRTYCVQYRESDYAFICRLMEEEGIYFYFIQEGKKEKMVLADSVSAHQPTVGGPEFEFHFKESEYRRRNDHIFDWSEQSGATTGKVTLKDYDFEKPSAEHKTIKTIEKGKHSHKSYEHYVYPGRTRTEGTAEDFAKVRMESEAVRHKLSRGACNIRTLGAGQTFKMKGHPRKKNNTEYLVVRTTHNLQIETDYEDNESKKPLFDTRLEVDEDNKDTYRCTFDVIPKSEPYRAPQDTPWPEIAGLQTAVVTGPSGEEIYTDKYGRIKVQFHWDRLGKKDDKTTCWVRVVMPWTGKNWGMYSIPRIGQEVVIQFEEGDPDRPICTGMLYNAETMPPYALPANMTQTGIVTRSTKSGSADTFNELVFEDKKDAEFVRLQSEKDYKETIKNNAVITVGMEKKDPGDLTQTIYNHKTETLKEGNHTFKVEKGTQEIFVKDDHKETFDAKSTQTITGDTSQTIKQGNLKRDVKMGNETVKIGLGNYSLKTAVGKISEEALQSIELKVGASSVKIDQTGVTIKGMMIKIEGTMMTEVKGGLMTSVKSDVMLMLKGGITMIN